MSGIPTRYIYEVTKIDCGCAVAHKEMPGSFGVWSRWHCLYLCDEAKPHGEGCQPSDLIWMEEHLKDIPYTFECEPHQRLHAIDMFGMPMWKMDPTPYLDMGQKMAQSVEDKIIGVVRSGKPATEQPTADIASFPYLYPSSYAEWLGFDPAKYKAAIKQKAQAAALLGSGHRLVFNPLPPMPEKLQKIINKYIEEQTRRKYAALEAFFETMLYRGWCCE